MIPGSQGHGLPPHLPHDRGSGPDFCNTHLLGMFLSFFLSERLLVYVMVRIRASLTQRDAELAALQHQLIEEDQNWCGWGSCPRVGRMSWARR